MVSIIIPAYNAERYLAQCLDSVMQCAQDSHEPAEVLVVDDGSTDSTGLIAARYAGVKVLSQNNAGLSAARNAGIAAATGEWLMFVDADDVLLPGAIDCLVALAVAHRCKIAAGGVVSGDTPETSTLVSAYGHEEVLSAPTAVERTLYQQTPLLGSAWGKIWHRSLFDDLRFTDGLYYEDLDLFYRAFLLAGAVVVCSRPVYFYRLHPTSFLRTFSPRILDVLAVTHRMEQYMSADYPALLKAARDRRLSANFNIYNRLHSAEASAFADRKAVADECWRTIRRLRAASLFNPRVRLKNKIGVLASYCGRRVYNIISSKFS